MLESKSAKAPDAFRTISEVADDLDLPQHVLRFWETRFNQIKPMKRGGGRRYYRPEDVDLLRGIRLLLYSEGFTIRGVQRLLKEKGLGFVVAVGQTGSVQTVTAAEQERAPAPPSAPPGLQRDSTPSDDAELAEPADLLAEEFRPDRSEPPPLPRAETPRAAPQTSLPPVALPVLTRENRRLIEAVLADLVEAKRLVDQVR